VWREAAYRVRELNGEVKLREILNVRKNVKLNCCLQ